MKQTQQFTPPDGYAAADLCDPGTPPARRERRAAPPAPVLQATGGGLSNNRWSADIPGT